MTLNSLVALVDPCIDFPCTEILKHWQHCSRRCGSYVFSLTACGGGGGVGGRRPLIAEGYEVTITDRGKAVARLVPPRPADAKPFRGRAAFRRRMPQLTTPVSSAILDGRAERR